MALSRAKLFGDYCKRVGRHWWLLVVGAIGGLLTIGSLVTSIVVPTWLGLVIFIGAFSAAQFRAFADVFRAPLRGVEFRNQTLYVADIGRDLGEGTGFIVSGRTFDDCTIKGPGFIVPMNSTFEHAGFAVDNTDDLVIVVPDRTLHGGVVAMGCTFCRCRFEGVGLIGGQPLLDGLRGATNLNPGRD